MITRKALLEEVKKLDETIADDAATTSTVNKGVLKALTLVVKLLRDIRANQVIDLKSRGVSIGNEANRDE